MSHSIFDNFRFSLFSNLQKSPENCDNAMYLKKQKQNKARWSQPPHFRTSYFKLMCFLFSCSNEEKWLGMCYFMCVCVFAKSSYRDKLKPLNLMLLKMKTLHLADWQYYSSWQCTGHLADGRCISLCIVQLLPINHSSIYTCRVSRPETVWH